MGRTKKMHDELLEIDGDIQEAKLEEFNFQPSIHDLDLLFLIDEEDDRELDEK